MRLEPVPHYRYYEETRKENVRILWYAFTILWYPM